jgi:hypothetical protein
MTGVVLQLDAVAGRLAAGDSSTVALSDLPSALGSRAGQALTETRQSVAAMRASPRAQPLHEQLATADVFGDGDPGPLHADGTVRRYPPMVGAEVVSIPGEAMTNARRRSGCRTVWLACG